MGRFSLIIIALLISSCYTQKRATMQVVRAHSEFPVVIAEFCASHYPPIIGAGRTDTVLQFDTLVEEHHYFNKTRDTITIERVRTVTRTETITRTDTVKSTAKIAAMQGRIDECNANYRIAEEGKNKWRNRALCAFAIIGVIGVGAIIRFVVSMKKVSHGPNNA